MNLLETFEKYKKVNNDYVAFIESLINGDLNETNEEEVNRTLAEALNAFEDIKFNCDELEVTEEELEDLKDLKYLLMDGLFAASDLMSFYKYKHYERFKMRATNYINKKRRKDNFGDNTSGCRVNF